MTTKKMNNKKNNPTKVITGEVRLSYANLWEAIWVLMCAW